MLRAKSGSDEQRRGLSFDVGGVPGSRRIDRIVARRQPQALLAPFGQLLNQRHCAGNADDEFVASRTDTHKKAGVFYGQW